MQRSACGRSGRVDGGEGAERGGRQPAAAFARPHQSAQAATSLAIVGWTGGQRTRGCRHAMALAMTLDTAAPNAATAWTASIFAL